MNYTNYRFSPFSMLFSLKYNKLDDPCANFVKVYCKISLEASFDICPYWKFFKDINIISVFSGFC